MKKIEKLTPEQEAAMPEYVEKWIKIGCNTDRLDPEKTEKTIKNYRRLIGYEEDAPLFIVDNPLEGWYASFLWLSKVPYENLRQELNDIFNGNPGKYKLPKASLPWQTGSFFASMFAFYDFFFEEVGIDIDKELYTKYKIWESTVQLGPIYPFKDLTIVSQKPIKISLNDKNVIHCDGGPAVEYAGHGDLKVFALNGVRVPEYVAVTPEEELDLEYYNTMKNADAKAEFVRKVGIERFKERGKLIDTYKKYSGDKYDWWHKSQYELWDMECLFEGLNTAPYLSMKNITTEIFHFEGVSPQCKTLEQALKERFGGRDMIINAIA
jgi:hypothetical protein